MKLLVLSDLHFNQDSDPTLIKDCLSLCRHFKGEVVIAGDALDVLENPTLLESSSFKRIYDELIQYKWIRGNHDFLTELPSELVIDNYLFCHGDRFDAFWSWWPFHFMWVPKFLQFYRTPAEKKKTDLLDYRLTTVTTEYKVTKYALKYKYRGVIIGHTHSPVIIERDDFLLLNPGDMVDSMTYALLDTETGECEHRSI